MKLSAWARAKKQWRAKQSRWPFSRKLRELAELSAINDSARKTRRSLFKKLRARARRNAA